MENILKEDPALYDILSKEIDREETTLELIVHLKTLLVNL